MTTNTPKMDITERLETMAGTVHSGAYEVMMEARRLICQLRKQAAAALPVQGEGAPIPKRVRLKLHASLSGMETPYGLYTKDDRQFILDNIGNEFFGVREGMNYYRLDNDVSVHVYNAFSFEDAPSPKPVAPQDPANAPVRTITTAQAVEALDNMDDYARMTVGVDAIGPRSVLERFIAQTPVVLAE